MYLETGSVEQAQLSFSHAKCSSSLCSDKETYGKLALYWGQTVTRLSACVLLNLPIFLNLLSALRPPIVLCKEHDDPEFVCVRVCGFVQQHPALNWTWVTWSDKLRIKKARLSICVEFWGLRLASTFLTRRSIKYLPPFSFSSFFSRCPSSNLSWFGRKPLSTMLAPWHSRYTPL